MDATPQMPSHAAAASLYVFFLPLYLCSSKLAHDSHFNERKKPGGRFTLLHSTTALSHEAPVSVPHALIDDRSGKLHGIIYQVTVRVPPYSPTLFDGVHCLPTYLLLSTTVHHFDRVALTRPLTRLLFTIYPRRKVMPL